MIEEGEIQWDDGTMITVPLPQCEKEDVPTSCRRSTTSCCCCRTTTTSHPRRLHAPRVQGWRVGQGTGSLCEVEESAVGGTTRGKAKSLLGVDR